MMRRSLYVLMICATAAAMAQAQTPALVTPQAPPTPSAPPTPVAPPTPAAPPTQATPPVPGAVSTPAAPTPSTMAPPTPAAQAAPPAPVAPVSVPAPAVPAEPVLDPLVKTDSVIGKGAEAMPGAKVFVHYTGWLYKPMAKNQRGRKFDSSVDRGEPLEFVLGTGRVIKGWDQGIAGMKVVGSSRVDLQACKLEYSIVSPK